MLTKQKLAEMNARGSSPDGRRLALFAALGAGVVAVALGLLVSYALGGAALMLGAALAFLLARRGSGAPKVELFYSLDVGAGARFSEIKAACEALAGAEKVWQVDGDGGTAGDAVAAPGPRRPVSVGLLETPGFSANIEVWGLGLEDRRLFFLPECVLSFKDERYQPISYDSLGVVYDQSRVAEDGEVPGDAEVVRETNGQTGGIRWGRGPEHPVVAYGLLAFTGLTPGEALRLLVSNKARAVRFARPFGAGKEEAQGGDARSAREARARRNAEAQAEKSVSLLRVLGVEPGASQAEIHAAYKKKARMYHPDRVASLAPEVREMAELRMKEINAAYGEIKRRQKSPGAR